MKIFSTRGMMFLLMVLVGLLLSGCETMDKAKKNQAMDFRLKEYAHEVRWGAIEALPAYLEPEMVEEQEPVATDPENIRVTDYEILNYPRSNGDGQIVQTVRINYLFRDRQVVHTLVDAQTWEYDEEDKIWYRVNPIPAFKGK
ncbi:MAG TPA: hypothetical protein ENG92_01175 [Thiolapillus brandeum]|uniref:Uncharacterized protein n=1 Tax=Thiolapillus brandeum TaxID=1076588 RepID=A0A831NXQ9_9GAMM|nr:hypothetical protein [Thiolapillus brandeum]